MPGGAYYGGERKFKDPDGGAAVTVRRPCLRCEREFDSVGPGNRLCDPCRIKAGEESPLAV